MNTARAALRAHTLPALAVLGFALAISTPPARAQSGLAAVRGDRASGWLAQSRSEVLARNGMVATGQPLAAEAGLRILTCHSSVAPAGDDAAFPGTAA